MLIWEVGLVYTLFSEHNLNKLSVPQLQDSLRTGLQPADDVYVQIPLIWFNSNHKYQPLCLYFLYHCILMFIFFYLHNPKILSETWQLARLSACPNFSLPPSLSFTHIRPTEPCILLGSATGQLLSQKTLCLVEGSYGNTTCFTKQTPVCADADIYTCMRT